jgi:hypothetical protein
MTMKNPNDKAKARAPVADMSDRIITVEMADDDDDSNYASWYSILLPYWYKSTNTDAEGAALLHIAVIQGRRGRTG